MPVIDCCLVVSDLHVLSTFALLRPGFTTASGNEIGLNPLQKWLWSIWEKSLARIDELARGREFITVINGDLIEGNHHRTTEILACEEAEHALAAIYTLKGLVDRSAKIAVVEGTECHTKGFENFIGREIGAVRDPDSGLHVFKEFRTRINGCLCSFRHHMPTTSRVYLEASQLSIQLGNAQLASARAGHEVPKVICAGHRHRAGIYSDGNGLMAVTPAWQGLTRHGRKVVPDGKMAPGFVWLDWANKEPGQIPDGQLHTWNPEPDTVVEL